MANIVNEVTIPILPSCALNETLVFYQSLGFAITYQQKSPNMYAVLKLRAIELHFYYIKGLKPQQNYGTCYIVVQNVDTLYRSFSEGLKTLLGKIPLRGIPRLNPLKDIPAYGVRQFIVVDPSGNYIRIGQPIPKTESLVFSEDGSKRLPKSTELDRALELGKRLADAKGDFAAAAKVLDKALSSGNPGEPVSRFRVLILRADVAIRLEDPTLARTLLSEADRINRDMTDKSAIQDDIRQINELRAWLNEAG